MGKLELIHHSAAKSKQNAKVIASGFVSAPGARRPNQRKTSVDASMISRVCVFFFSLKVLFAEIEEKKDEDLQGNHFLHVFFGLGDKKKIL